MTCIVGYIEKSKTNTTIYIGGDSAGSSGNDITLRNDPKVFIKENKTDSFIFGFTSSFRMGQILMSTKFNPPVQKSDDSDYNYLITDFVDEIRKTFKDGGYLKTKEGVEVGGTFLVGYRNKLYTIESDFQVGEALTNYVAVGAGEDYALGAMYILEENTEYTGNDKIYKALEASAKFNTTVHSPFKILQIIEKIDDKHIRIG